MNSYIKPRRSESYIQGEQTLSTTLHPLYEQMVAEYTFAALKHHGRSFVSPKVIAELIKMGWTSSPVPAEGQLASTARHDLEKHYEK